jgi:hypothetical protein
MQDPADRETSPIPQRLSKLAYLYFLLGAWDIALGLFFIGLHMVTGAGTGNNLFTTYLALCIGSGFFLIGLSRGLRRGSRGWRICALFITLGGLAAIAFRGYSLLAPYFQAHAHKPLPELSSKSILLLFCALLVQLWQYRVLTHPDVVDFFHGRK